MTIENEYEIVIKFVLFVRILETMDSNFNYLDLSVNPYIEGQQWPLYLPRLGTTQSQLFLFVPYVWAEVVLMYLHSLCYFASNLCGWQNPKSKGLGLTKAKHSNVNQDILDYY